MIPLAAFGNAGIQGNAPAAAPCTRCMYCCLSCDLPASCIAVCMTQSWWVLACKGGISADNMRLDNDKPLTTALTLACDRSQLTAVLRAVLSVSASQRCMSVGNARFCSFGSIVYRL
jgi:hypothetical protein